MSQNIPYEIIIASIENNASTNDLKMLNEWIASSPKNKEVYSSIKSTWENTKLKRTSFSPDINLALNKTHQRIKRRVLIRRSSQIAAILIIGLGISLFFNLFDRTNNWHSVTAEHQQKITLEDGTTVVLNKGAIICYPEHFNGNRRSVKLEGKAYFDVHHNRTKPFIVETDYTKTEVLGTKFTLISNSVGKDMLYLDEGKVKFSSQKWFGPKLLVDPGEKIVLSNNELIKTIAVNDNLSTWATNKLIFKDITLIDLVNQLQDYYQTPIMLSTPQINNLRFSGTLTQSTAQKALEIVAITLQLELSTNNNTLTLSL